MIFLGHPGEKVVCASRRREGRNSLTSPRFGLEDPCGLWTEELDELCALAFFLSSAPAEMLRADFREGDEDSNFSIFRVWRFSEWPEPLH